METYLKTYSNICKYRCKLALKKIYIILLSEVLLIILLFSFSLFFQGKASISLNCIWIDQLSSQTSYNEISNPQALETILQGSSINCVMIFGGYWSSSGTIIYDAGTSQWTNFINVLHSSGYKVFVWINAWNTSDLSSASTRQTMYDSATLLLNTYNFDGFNDDYEGWRGNTSFLVTYEQTLATTVRNLGKIASADLEVNWGGATIQELYPQLTNLNYIMPMYYTNIASDGGNIWNSILTNAAVPVVMGIDFSPQDSPYTTASSQLQKITNFLSSYSTTKLAGFAIWSSTYFSSTDLASWNNWTPKNIVTLPTPSQSLTSDAQATP